MTALLSSPTSMRRKKLIMPHVCTPTTRVALTLVLPLMLVCVCFLFAPRAHTSAPPPAAPQAAADTVRELPLPTNDIIYDPATQRIYASVPGWVGTLGNSLTPIDPSSSSTGAPVFVGSEPGRMALSDNGQYIYVGLNGAGAVRRYDVAAHAPDLFFNLGGGTARDLSVMPGNPHAVAVSRMDAGLSPDYLGVNIYDDGVARPVAAGLDSTSHGANFIEFSPSPAVVYGSGGGRYQRVNVTPSGLTIVRSAELPSGDLKFDGGLLYTPTGQVFDPEAERLVGTYDLQYPPYGGTPRLVLPDPVFDRVYFIIEAGGRYVLRVYQKSSFQLVGTLDVGSGTGFATSLVRWGTHGLAFRIESKVFLIQTPLVPSPAPFPSPMPSPTPTPAPTPVPTPAPGELRIISLAANDLVVEPRTQLLYASVSASAADRANTITPISPDSGALGDSVFVGSEPNKMAVSDDGRFIYVGLDGANAVRRYGVDARAAGLQFNIKPADSTQQWRASDLAVLPGRPESVVVARMFPQGTNAGTSTGQVVAYDDGVERPGIDTFQGADLIEFSSNPSVLYGYANVIGTYSFQKMVVAPCGVGTGSSVGGLLNGPASDFKVDNVFVYGTTGRVIDPEAGIRLGSYPIQGGFGVVNGAVLPDSRANRVYFITSDFSTSTHTLYAYDQRTFLKVGSMTLPGTSGFPSGLVRWGTNGLAYRTSDKQVVIIQTPLVAAPSLSPAPAPTPATPTLGLRGTITEFPPPFDNSPLEGVSLSLTGTQSATTTPGVGGKYSFGNLAPCGDFTVTPSAPFTSFRPASMTFNGLLGFRTADFTATVKRFSVFLGAQTVPESTTAFFINVSRSAADAGPATIDYATSDGTASGRSDYTPGAGTLRFATNEAQKFLLINVTDDALAESPETFTLTFSNPTGALPPASGSYTLTINSDDAADGPSPVADASFNAQFFVRQHYLDFLGRAPDAAGANFWAGQTGACGSPDPVVCRVNVSASFFLSIEFQETGYLVYKTYGAAYGPRRVGDTVPLTLQEFLPDTQAIGANVVVNQGAWQAQLEANKQSYFGEFVSRPSFAERYPASMTAARYVDALNANAAGALTAAERDNLVTRLESGELTRAQVLRAVAENEAFTAREKNRAFVLMQYFGYLRRNPYDAPEPTLDFAGYNFWLSKLEEFRGNFVRAEMVKAFISSDEYRKRFGR
jgi:hypothetical protein